MKKVCGVAHWSYHYTGGRGPFVKDIFLNVKHCLTFGIGQW
jgi:hypothetical protein